MLLGEQLGRRHDGRLHPAGDRLEARDRGDHGLARSDVALDQAHHRVWCLEIVEDLGDDTLLCAREPERQVGDEVADLGLAAGQRNRGLGLGECPEVAQAEVVGQQLLEREASLARVRACQQPPDVGVGWGPVQVADGVGQRRQAELVDRAGRQQLVGRVLRHAAQRLVGQVPQPALLYALGRGVDGGQRIRCRAALLSQQAVFGMNHLEAGAALANLAEAVDAHADLELCLLLAREMEEAQRQLTRAVADAHEQVAAAPVDCLRQQHLALYEAPVAGAQGADGNQLGPILVAER